MCLIRNQSVVADQFGASNIRGKKKKKGGQNKNRQILTVKTMSDRDRVYIYIINTYILYNTLLYSVYIAL